MDDFDRALNEAGRAAANLAAQAFEATSGESALTPAARVRRLQELANEINAEIARARLLVKNGKVE